MNDHKSKWNPTDRPSRVNSGVEFYLDIDDLYLKSFSELMKPQGSLPWFKEYVGDDIEKTNGE